MEPIQIDHYEVNRLKQLQNIHNSHVLLFSKDKFCPLGRKLRPELGKLYMSSEFKDCSKLLDKIDDEYSDYHIDLVIVEYDSTAVRLIDVVNKRLRNIKTRKLPVIPTIAIFNPETSEHEALEHLIAVGGVTKIIKSPHKSKDVLYCIMEVLSTQKLVEKTFKDASKKKIISSKYPYLQIFDGQHNGNNNNLELSTTKNNIETSSKSNISFRRQSEFDKIDELDDATECSSLIPNFIKNIRKENSELLSPFIKSKRENMNNNNDNDENIKHPMKDHNKSHQNFHDDNSNKNENDDVTLTSNLDENYLDSNKPLSTGSNAMILTNSTHSNPPSHDLLLLPHNTTPVLAAAAATVPYSMMSSLDAIGGDTLKYGEDSLDNISVASLLRETIAMRTSNAAATGGNNYQSEMELHNKDKNNSQNKQKKEHLLSKSYEILDIQSRPIWNKQITKKVDPIMNKRSIQPFVHKPPPVIQRPSTVGGIDKKYADLYWNIINPKKTLSTTVIGVGMNTTSSSGKLLPDINKNTSAIIGGGNHLYLLYIYVYMNNMIIIYIY